VNKLPTSDEIDIDDCDLAYVIMSQLATKDFLDHIQSLYPTNHLNSESEAETILDNKWYIVTAVAFSASNFPDEVPHVFKYALHCLSEAHARSKAESDQAHKDRLTLARRFRDALFVAGVTSGFARCINSCMALDAVMPEELKDREMLRDAKKPIEQLDAHGKEVFHAMYGKTAEPVQAILDSIYPDLGWFCNTIAYGFIYGYQSYLSQVESSYTMVAALIAFDTPRQIGWHLSNARRGGATLEELKAVRTIAMEVSEKVGIKWKAGVPEIEDD